MQDIQAVFDRQGAMRHLGIRIVSIAPGAVDLELPWCEEVGQHHGYFHGGVLAALLDTACGLAALTTIADGYGVVSAEFKINFLVPARGALVRAEGRVVRAGRMLTVCTGTASIGARAVALMQATMAGVPDGPTASVPEGTTASVPEGTTANVPEGTTTSLPV